MALGLFISMLPVMWLQMPIAILIAEVIRRTTSLAVSRVAAAAGVCLPNPLTAAPIYGLCFVVGRPFARLLLHGEVLSGEQAAMPTGEFASVSVTSVPFAWELGLGLLIGGVLLGIPVAVAGYILTHRIVTRYQARRALRRAQGSAQAPSPP